MKDTKIGVITSGIPYLYVKEALPEASVLKLGMKEINVLKAAGIVEEITTGAGETLYTLADSTKDIVAAYARERR